MCAVFDKKCDICVRCFYTGSSVHQLQVIREIHDYVCGESTQPLILSAESGCGKTAILAKAYSQVYHCYVVHHVGLMNHLVISRLHHRQIFGRLGLCARRVMLGHATELQT